MADRYIHVPAHMVKAAVPYGSAEDAAEDASKLVEKDRVRRMILRVHAEVRVSETPKVDIVQIAECGRG